MMIIINKPITLYVILLIQLGFIPSLEQTNK